MKRILFRFGLCISALIICETHLFAQEKKRGNPYAEGENIYKHYTGTIGKRKVVLDLVWGYQGGSNFGGSYYYFTDSPHVYRMAILEPPTFEHTERLHAVVDDEENPWQPSNKSFNDADITWDFFIQDSTLTGVYKSKASGEEQTMYLVETRGQSLAFDIVIGSDRAIIPSPDGAGIRADIFTLGITPSRQYTNITEMDFVNRELLNFSRVENIQSEYIADYYKAMRVNFIKAAKIYFTRLFESGKPVNPEDAAYKSHTSRSLIMRPIYNDTGFLVIRKYYTDGGNRSEDFLNLDVKSAKRLALKDILKINPRVLSWMLETAFRRKYGLGNEAKLNQWLTVERLPVPEKFSLSPGGLTFYFDKKALIKDKNLSGWDPFFSVYLSYDQLRGMIRRDFAEKRLWPVNR